MRLRVGGAEEALRPSVLDLHATLTSSHLSIDVLIWSVKPRRAQAADAHSVGGGASTVGAPHGYFRPSAGLRPARPCTDTVAADPRRGREAGPGHVRQAVGHRATPPRGGCDNTYDFLPVNVR